MQHPEYDVIVVGAGVAGGALATSLARDGRRVLVIERELYDGGALVEPDRIVGELLQPGGVAKLHELGLTEAVDTIDAQFVYGYGLFLYERAECIDYVAHAPRVAGRSFHNGRFLRRLRELAAHERNVSLVHGTVVALDKDQGGRVIGVSYKNHLNVLVHATAALTIACDGCASRLRRRAAPDAQPQVYSQFVGLLLDAIQLPFPSHGHVVLARPAPVLFYPVSSTHVRCLVDIPSTVQTPAREHLLNVVAPQLPQTLREPFIRAATHHQLRTMPNRVMPAAPALVPGAVLLGDSFNMRHPLTGGGMTVALSDVAIIRQLLRQVPDLLDISTLECKLAQFYHRRKPLSTTINILANALYAIFCASDDPALEYMRTACFDYLASGGRMTHDPMGLIGGVKPRPALLVTHFFLVALYGCGRALAPFPTPSRLWRAWTIFRASVNIVKPLIDAEDLRPLSWLPFTSL